ncbi:MAG: ABC transporter permease [Calditerrivibrio sp.]|uniref:ABC transporter permease n=1 Tax=Calditerrivibrio sp. TaxID=2792612 RepID=UPI003D0A0456
MVKRNKLFIAGISIIIFFTVVAIFAPIIAPYDPSEIDLMNILNPPSLKNLFGTDELGRDVFSRVVYGTRISLSVGFISVGISVFIGTIIGLVSGYFKGLTDLILMKIVDIALCFPTFFLILAVIAFLKPSIYNIMIVIGITSWMGVARMVRAETMSITERDYITAAKVAGLKKRVILFKHILPNVASPILVSATLGVASSILVESALSFLGLGVQPPTPSWGNIITSGKDNIMFAWWLSFFPGICILLAVLGFNLTGEGLRDILDPKSKE